MEQYNQYEASKVISGYAQQAMRKAVLHSLLSREVYQNTDIPTMLKMLREQWHARLYSLQKAHWPPIAEQKNMTYMMNCPPFGISTETSAHCCRWRRFCPFCWARSVVSPLYDRLLAACYDDRKPRPFRVALIRRTTILQRSVHTVQDSENFLLSRGVELAQVPKWVGSFSLQTVEFFPKTLRHTRRVVVILPEHAPPLSIEQDHGLIRINEPEGILRKTLAKITALAAFYPWQMMRCSPEDFVKFLHLTENIRLSSYQGCLRQGGRG